MSLSLVKKTFAINDLALDCWIVILQSNAGVPEFWFKGTDIAAFLGYVRPRKAISDHVLEKHKREWRVLSSQANGKCNTHSNWQPHTVFISEPGLYALTFRSRKAEAMEFTNWVCEKVLPRLRCNALEEYITVHRDFSLLLERKSEATRGFIYLATTRNYATRGIYKIGFTANLEQRLCGLNTVRLDDDRFSFVGTWSVADCQSAEKHVFATLHARRVQNEFFEFESKDQAVDLITSALK